MNRSLLFIPGNNPGMLFNALVLPADTIIIDLEDAVTPESKDEARKLVSHAAQSFDYAPKNLMVRINALETPYWREDCKKMLAAGVHLLMPPKVAGAGSIQELAAYLDEVEAELGLEPGVTRLTALIETAEGVENAYNIAKSSPRVRALFLGAEDLTADLGCRRTKGGREIFYARTRLVNAAKAAGLEVIDTPFTDVNDDAGAEKDARTAVALGFTGKAAISPRHLAIINRIFSPSEEEVFYAKEVMAAIELGRRTGKGAVSLRGKMVDAPIVARAERVLAMHEEILARS